MTANAGNLAQGAPTNVDLAGAIGVMALLAHGNDAAADSGGRVEIIRPGPGMMKPSGTWSVGARAGDFVFVSGVRGVDAETGAPVAGEAARIRRMFDNLLAVAAEAGAARHNAVRITIFVTDIALFGPLIDSVQKDIWGDGPYPPRTMLEAPRLEHNDIAEIDGVFYAPLNVASEK